MRWIRRIQYTSVVSGCHFATGIFTSKHQHFSINTFIFNEVFNPDNSFNSTSSSNKSKSYLLIIVCCCGREFQFFSVPTHSRLPSRSALPTFYIPKPQSPLGYDNTLWWEGFVCSVGGKAWTGQISLKRHVRLHSGEKSFCCHCGECFTLKHDLKRHTERLHAVKQ
jgi:hypothetical protein